MAKRPLHHKDDYRNNTLFLTDIKITQDNATAMAKARRLDKSVNGKSTLPWPVIWKDSDYAITFVNGPDSIGKACGEFVTPLLIPISQQEALLRDGNEEWGDEFAAGLNDGVGPVLEVEVGRGVGLDHLGGVGAGVIGQDE